MNTRRDFLKTAGLATAAVSALTWPGCTSSAEASKPNIVLIFVDDMGYGDAGCFGHPTIATPHLDQMARDGMKLTQFYVASSVCSPSRASLLTGLLPKRTGVTGVLWPNSQGGINKDKALLSTELKAEGYATACVGKWHMGHRDGYAPTDRGFDSYFGIPYSNDMFIGSYDPVSPDVKLNNGYTLEKLKADQRQVKELEGKGAAVKKTHMKYQVPLFEGKEIVEYPADQTTLTPRYTERSVDFIRRNKNKPFFLYLAHSFPHIPLFASKDFADRSRRGLYGDVIEELDWSVGEILKTLQEEGLEKNTWVVFTSDNGPWLGFKTEGGSGGLLRGGKFSTWEGGMRVPCIMQWPGKIPAASVSMALSSTLDIVPTVRDLLGMKQPDDQITDGYSLRQVIFENSKSPRNAMFFYGRQNLSAVRLGPWKLHFEIHQGPGYGKYVQPEKPLLYNLEHDPGEQYDVADQHPDVVAEIRAVAKKHLATFAS